MFLRVSLLFIPSWLVPVLYITLLIERLEATLNADALHVECRWAK